MMVRGLQQASCSFLYASSLAATTSAGRTGYRRTFAAPLPWKARLRIKSSLLRHSTFLSLFSYEGCFLQGSKTYYLSDRLSEAHSLQLA